MVDPVKRKFSEAPFVKTKIIATVGPASKEKAVLTDLIRAGVDIFRLNFAHGTHEWLDDLIATVREITEELKRPIAFLADLSGPKIRLGQLPDEGLNLRDGQACSFVRQPTDNPLQLTCTYEKLIDDLSEGDRVLLADGTVSLRVQKSDADEVNCIVEQGGLLRSKQGVNLPGVKLSTPSLTKKDRVDLAWAIKNQIDFVGLSFVRSADDIKLLRSVIAEADVPHPPHIVAKIEKTEAVEDLDAILDVTDAVMVARGDLGVEADITQVPVLQKHIIHQCNLHRIPVITATQMLDSMQDNELPTRAEASDVANAVLDGTDAVMLSGETAIGAHPVRTVSMMNRIAQNAESLVQPTKFVDTESGFRNRAHIVTEAVTLGASTAAEHLQANLIVVATRSGRTAMAVSKQRSPVPILAVTDSSVTARRMCLYWGVTPLVTKGVDAPPQELLNLVVDWIREKAVLASGSRLVLVGHTAWSARGNDLMIVHAIP